MAAKKPAAAPKAKAKRPSHVGFQPGNEWWKARSSAGPKPKFATAEALWEACCEYFAWMQGRPLIEVKPFAYEGNITMADLPHQRAMTLASLCVFLDIDYSTWDAWRKDRPDLSEVITRVERMIFAQKFEGAAAGLFNANIIARDLGLADKKELSGGLVVEGAEVTFRTAPKGEE